MTYKFFIIFLLLLFSANAEAARLHPERFYQQIWCDEHNGKVEHILPDRSRVDCLTEEYAVEVDFADKWPPKVIGQSVFYAQMMDKKPEVVLIMEIPEKDYKYLIRLLIPVQSNDGFAIWIISSNKE